MLREQPTTDAAELDLATDTARGLTADEAARRLARFGENALAERRVGVFERAAGFFWGPIPWMIEAAAILSAVVRHWADFAIILFMLLVNAGVGFWQEFKADNAIELLKRRLALKARVIRDGEWREIPASNLVPGDVVKIKLGGIIPADVRLVAGDYLSVDEAALTGESLPVDKKVGDTAYSGSIAKLGEMTGIVVATGMNTYFGRTARLVQQAKTVSHFQRAVLKIGNFLILVTLGLVAIIGVVALFRHDPLFETAEFALILAVASIPVALPAVLSVTMAVGAERLARLKAIVSRLVAVEELAGMDMLCSDKTGTLTKNELTLGDPEPTAGIAAQQLVLAAALASQREAPDAIDAAILAAAADQAVKAYQVTAFRPFDPVAKRTEAEVAHEGARFRVSKGAPQVIFELCKLSDEARGAAMAQVDAAAVKGLRMIGVARADAGDAWRFLGLLPLFDPPRDDSAQTIAQARAMGLDIKMITGDHEAIAREIAGQLGLGKNIVVADTVFGSAGEKLPAILAADGFARVFPEHKFEIVKTLQGAGRIVGMTGDGVNDAPALKQADVGIAVSGATDAARAAADLVLTAPGLSVITTAIEEARRIFERMTGYAIYRIAETIRVLLFMTASILVFNFYPVTAVMVVLLALLNDIPIMMIAYDNAPFAAKPVRWDMSRVLTIASILGVYGVIESFGLYWVVRDYLALPQPTVQALIFLKLLVSGHMTIYLTRNKGPLWERPWPSWKLVVPCEATQLLGTLAVVYGWFMTATGWRLALMVWAYSLTTFIGASVVKWSAYHLMEYRSRRQARHLARVERSFAGRPIPAGLGPFVLGAFAVALLGAGTYWAIDWLTPVGYRTAAISRGPIVRTVELKGFVEPAELAFASARVAGLVAGIFCDIDMKVERGTVCAKIDQRPFADAAALAKADLDVADAQLARNQLALARARVELNAARRRFGRGRIVEERIAAYDAAQADVDLTKATAEKKRAALRAAEDDLAATDVVAPAPGVIIAREIALGQPVSPKSESAVLFTIAGDMTKMQIIAHVSQRELGDLEPGDEAKITTDRLPHQILQATVAEVRSTRRAGAYDVVFDVDNAQLVLKPGMAVTAKVTTARRDEALRAPDQALDFSPARAPSPPEGFSWLWLLRNGKAEAVPVKLGLDDGSFTEILDGEIKPGDRVIIGRTR